MSDFDQPSSAISAGTAPALLAASLAAGANGAKVDQLLDRQIAIADLQIEDLKREDRLRHWSLRVRHISDVLKLSLELAVAFIVFLVALGLIAAIWHAAGADGLVIEPFNVPASMVEKGLSGEVVASKLLDRLDSLQAETESGRAASSYSNDWTNDIKVEIPDTGISIGQVMRYLNDALGHQMHLSGEVYETASGLALTTRLDNAPGETFEGNDLDAVVERAAEAAYRRAQPYRYSVYLGDHGRLGESIAIEKTLAAGQSAVDRGWANEALAIRAADEGRVGEAKSFALRVLADIPNLPNAFGILSQIDMRLGHDEDALREAEQSMKALQGPGRASMSSFFERIYPHVMLGSIAGEKGDYAAAVADLSALRETGRLPLRMQLMNIEAMNHDTAAARAGLANMHFVPPTPEVLTAPADNTLHAEALTALGEGDWRRAVQALEAEIDADATVARQGDVSDKAVRLRQNDPLLAYAYARLGNMAKANALLTSMPLDCDECVRTRGKIDSLARNWNGAAYWFAIVAARSPDIPFADTDWGAELLREGKYDAAIEKFREANLKGPHFADPLEMWGEALVRENRSDLALAKFAEADKYAPNWGRLHLKWGEALLWFGDKAGAQKQFAIATSLDLTSAERSEVARTKSTHV